MILKIPVGSFSSVADQENTKVHIVYATIQENFKLSKNQTIREDFNTNISPPLTRSDRNFKN